MPQTIDLYTPQRQAMADALRLLQQRQAMNEQRRQFNAAQGLDEQKVRMLQQEADAKAAWEAEQQDRFRREYDQMPEWARTATAYNIGTGNSPNAEFVSRSAQNETLTPEQITLRNLIESGQAASAKDLGGWQNSRDVATINTAPQMARVGAQNAADYGRANASNASAKLFTLRADNPQTGQKPVQTRLDPQTEAKAKRLDDDIKNLDAQMAQVSQIATGSKEPDARRRADKRLTDLQAQRNKKQQEYDNLVKTFPTEAYTTPGATNEGDDLITAAILRELNQ